MGEVEGRSLAETPSWAVASVITVMVVFGFSIQGSLRHCAKWLDRTKRKSVLAALEKIKEEIMVFGILSLLMGHWIMFISNICISSSAMSSRFYPCALPKEDPESLKRFSVSYVNRHFNYSVHRHLEAKHPAHSCPEGREPLASRESLEQLHRLLFVLGVTHVSYSFIAIALAMFKMYSWRTWENQAMAMVPAGNQDTATSILRMNRLSTFIYHNTAHPWSQHKVLVWLLCFSRQFWSSINRADYMALRLGFISTHQLPVSYDFLKYMIRSMEEEFRDIVGISIPLWIFAILCMFLDFHGTEVYFWISFLPAILILLVGTKLHRIVVKLAVEIMSSGPRSEYQRFNLRDELFWFGKPKFLLCLVQFISFQNAFEMATFIWSYWEIEDPSCFINNRTFLAIRLSFGVISQVWCSFITFPLYIIITQMGSRFKKTIVSENVRKSLNGWRRRVQTRRSGNDHPLTLLTATSLDSLTGHTNNHDENDDSNNDDNNDDDDDDDDNDDGDDDDDEHEDEDEDEHDDYDYDDDDIERNKVGSSSRKGKSDTISRLRSSVGFSQVPRDDDMLQDLKSNHRRTQSQSSAIMPKKPS